MRSALRHYIGPCELISSSLPTLLSYVPWLHGHYPFLRYYGRSDPDRPFVVADRGSLIHVNRISDHSVSNHPRFSTSRVHSLCAGSSISFGLRHCARRLARTADRIEFTLILYRESALRTGRSLPVALHPGLSPRCSYFQFLALQCQPGQGLSPCYPIALSGARRNHVVVDESLCGYPRVGFANPRLCDGIPLGFLMNCLVGNDERSNAGSSLFSVESGREDGEWL